MKSYKPKKCLRCGKEFSGQGVCKRDWITRKYCSRECSDISRRGVEKTSTTKNCIICNKEMKKLYAESWSRWGKKKFCSKECVKKGANYKAPTTAFKKGNKPWNFKASGYGYQAVHRWIDRHYIKTGFCQRCGKEGYTEWSNISGNYERNINDFVELCRSCHAKEDSKNPKKPKYKQS